MLLVAALLGWPQIRAIPFSILGDANLAATYVIITVSLVLLTGWVGQISLAQAAFVGIGAFSTGVLSRSFHMTFPLNLLVAALIAGAAAASLGMVALRVRGLYLAVATLIFGWMADAYLFNAPWLVGVGGSSSIRVDPVGRLGGFPYFDLTDRRTFYYVVLACAALAVFVVANVRDSKTGRAFFAIRGSEMAAASLGINVTRYKLLAFAISGFLAGAAGNLTMMMQRTVVPAQFAFTASLFALSVAVVGGLGSLGGAVAASVLFAALKEVFFQFRVLGGYLELVSAGLLAVVLLAYRGGLADVPRSLRPFVLRAAAPVRWIAGKSARLRSAAARIVARPVRGLAARTAARTGRVVARIPVPRRPRILRLGRRGRDDAAAGGTNGQTGSVLPAAAGAVGVLAGPVARDEREIVLALEDVTVAYGGLIAVEEVSLEIRRGEIVGLIGPNGAGKTTTFNAISGLALPRRGSIRLFGRDVTRLPVHERAGLGMGRTFQVLQLFTQLSVFENLLVATHVHNRSNLFDHAFVTRRSLLAEMDARARVGAVVDMLGLEEIADRRVAGLPFGVLRMVELGRALVTGAPLVMLDEAASGLDNTETDRLSELLLRIRADAGVSVLLIEHDVRMVTALSDFMYVLDRGRVLASGTPHDVRGDAGVVAAYLGESREVVA